MYVCVCVAFLSFFSAFVFLCEFICYGIFFCQRPIYIVIAVPPFPKKLRFLFWSVTFYELSHKISSMAKSSLQINEFLIAYTYSLVRLSCNQREVFVYSYSFLHINLYFFFVHHPLSQSTVSFFFLRPFIRCVGFFVLLL